MPPNGEQTHDSRGNGGGVPTVAPLLSSRTQRYWVRAFITATADATSFSGGRGGVLHHCIGIASIPFDLICGILGPSFTYLSIDVLIVVGLAQIFVNCFVNKRWLTNWMLEIYSLQS
jgi:hypothetical protein